MGLLCKMGQEVTRKKMDANLGPRLLDSTVQSLGGNAGHTQAQQQLPRCCLDKSLGRAVQGQLW